MIDYKKLGLSIYPDYISEEEHKLLISEIEHELSLSNQPKYIDRNKVLRYGNSEICANNYQHLHIPENIKLISTKLVDDNILPYFPDAININEYLKNDFIAPHIDRVVSGKIVTILSLKSHSVMSFTSGKDRFDIDLEPKMLIQMQNSIRWHWHHEIYPVADTRYSIVFRNKYDTGVENE